ncbi:MAG: UbiA family prenyltransferase, partial [Acidobacteria bacterium]|nr:UbiA family prenyltransferase [Acidobacteriota bacterium]
MARTSPSPDGVPPAVASAAIPRPTLGLVVTSLRPEQWTKNLILFAGLIFGGRLLEIDAVLSATAAFVLFCGLSGAVYLFNDVWDRDSDRRHPLKRERPVAAGTLATSTALAVAAALGGGAVSAAFWLSVPFGAAAAAYCLLLVTYSTALKHVVIIDVLTISGGFVLRAIAGALAVDVPIGTWLLTCTSLLAMFLALSKRRHELALLGEAAVDHRRTLVEYSPYLLDQMISVVTASTLIAYATFAFSVDTARRLGTPHLG